MLLITASCATVFLTVFLTVCSIDVFRLQEIEVSHKILIKNH